MTHRRIQVVAKGPCTENVQLEKIDHKKTPSKVFLLLFYALAKSACFAEKHNAQPSKVDVGIAMHRIDDAGQICQLEGQYFFVHISRRK